MTKQQASFWLDEYLLQSLIAEPLYSQPLPQKYAERSRQVCPSGAQGFSRHKVKASRSFF
jgi:hypothetical protein